MRKHGTQHIEYILLRMSQEEITQEIVKIERLISDLKREYKTLLSKSHVTRFFVCFL